MKRLLVVIAAMLFFGGGVLALIWFGNSFLSYASSKHNLRVEMPIARKLPLGTKVAFNLRGSGFNRETETSLFMKINNQEAVVGSFPLEGIYNESLQYGDFLFLARERGGLQVLNIKDPRQPQLVKEYLVGRTIVDIHRSGTIIYLSCGKLGMSIMQILPNGLLHHVTDIAMESHALMGQAYNGFLFVATGNKGLSIYDIRQPDQAQLVGVLRPDLVISKLVREGSFLYLSVAGNKIEIYQIAEPQSPQLTKTLRLTDDLYDLIVHQQQLYIATKSGVLLYDITNASQPELLHKWTEFGSARKLFGGSDSVYISDSFSGLRVVGAEIEGPHDYVNLNIDPRTISVTSDYLYIAGSNKGLLIVDKNELLPRQVIQTFNTPGSAHDIFIKGGWMYIADARGGVLLQNLEIEDEMFTTVTPRWGESFLTDRDLLYVAQAKMGIEVFDISDPGDPKSIVIWPDLQAMRLAVVGDYLLSSKGISGVKLIDISDIYHPIVKDVLPEVHALDITVDGHLIYIVSKKQGLLIYEITDNEKLSRLSRVSTPFPMNQFDLSVAVQVKDDIAYVANGRAGLLIVDVKKATAPIILGSIGIAGISKAVKISGNKAVITSHLGGISVVNIADPENPILMNSVSMPGLSRGLQVVDDLIYVTQKEMGVAVVPVPIAAEMVKVLSAQQMQVTIPSPKLPGSYSLQINNQRESVVSDDVVIYQ